MLEEQLRDKLAGHEDILANVIQFSHSLLENTKGGLIAGIGLVVLFWSVLKVLGQIEYSFNDIWGIKERRTIGRMFGDYLSLILICPVIIILSGSVTVFITTQVTLITEKVAILGNLRFLPAQVASHLQILHHGHAREDVAAFRHSADSQSDDILGIEMVNPFPQKTHRSGTGLKNPRDDLEGRRFPGPVRPDERNDLPLLNRQGDLFQNLDFPVMSNDLIQF
jgi:hypothetical protein